MQGSYQPVQLAIQGAQTLAMLALVLCVLHMTDCAGNHTNLIRRQVKQECLREPP